MVTSILEIFKVISSKAQVSTNGKVELTFMVILSTEQEKEQEFGFPTYFLKNLTFIKDHMKTTKRMVMAYISGSMKRYMMEILRMTSVMMKV